MQAIRDNIGIALIALIVTALIKSYIYVIDPPTSLEVTVPVQAKNLAQGLSITSIVPNRIELEIRGPKSKVDQLRERDFRAVVDCSNIQNVDSVMLNVSLSQRQPQGVRCSIIPEKVNVIFGKFERKFLSPEMKTVGEMKGNRVISTIEGLPETVKISGSAEELNRIDKVQYELNVDQIEDEWSTEVEFVAVDHEGNAISYLQIDPDFAMIKVTLSKHMALKSVPVVPVVTGAPALNHAVISQIVDPLYVQISGSPEALMSVSNVSTSTVNIANATETISRTTGLISPKPGVVLEPDSVRVNIEIRQVTTQRTVDVLVDIRGRKAELDYQLNPSSISILIQGPVSKVRTLDLKLVKSHLDASIYDIGTHKVQLNYPDLPSEIALLKMNPIQATLIVKKTDDNPE